MERYVPSAARFGVAGAVSAIARVALRVARKDVPKYRGGEVAAYRSELANMQPVTYRSVCGSGGRAAKR